ncbi:MAG: phosphoglycerate transporter [Dehalococcoidia bacterium]|nr:MAG: phosphoglycerate transporter [Dehalococcoidia bacterium]
MYRIGWFSTGRDEAARNLLAAAVEAIKNGEVKAVIEFVFCSREPGESPESDAFIEQVERYGLPLVCYSYQRFKARTPADTPPSGSFPSWRLTYDREVMSRLGDLCPDLCVLAGYMLIVGPEMCTRYTMINLHPALPSGPTGTWQEVVWQLIEQKASETGVMMHLVTPELDRGPVASYCRFSIRGGEFDTLWSQMKGKSVSDIKKTDGECNPLFRLIRAEGLKREFPLIIATIKAFSERRVRVEAGKVIDSHGKIIPGYDLTREIDRLVSKA